MRALILVAGAALAISACSKNEAADNTMNVDETMTTNEVMDNTAVNADVNATDANMTMNADANATATTDANATDANTTNAQ